MSFYLDDYPDDDQPSTQICPNCSGSSFYNDPVTGTLTCSSCYTQSQTATQEELDFDDSVGLAAARGGKRTYVSGGSKGNGERKGRPLMEYDTSKKLPDAESCCLAFQWLLWDASKRVTKLAGIQEDADDNANENQRSSIMERTVKKIWFAYLHTWMNATREYSAKYPEIRVSFRDYFLGGMQKGHLMRHLSVTVGRKVEDELIEEMRRKYRDNPNQRSDDGDSDSFSSHGSSNDEQNSVAGKQGRKRKRTPFLTIAQLCKRNFPANPKRYPNGIYQLHPHQAALKIQPSLTLLLSILQLALTHLRTGVAPHHLTRWVSNGQLPHGLNGYAQLPEKHKERVNMVKNFFVRSFVPPAEAVGDLADMLATACRWFDKDRENSSQTTGRATSSVSSDKINGADMPSSHQRSLYNVPLLTARMVQDFGFEQRVLDNALAFMGIISNHKAEVSHAKSDDNNEPESDAVVNDGPNEGHQKTTTLAAPIKSARPDKLHTPLHVAAVIIMACKLCPGWEEREVTNLHASSAMKGLYPQRFVPWNESQFQLLGNGPTLNNYIDFLVENAFNGVVEPSTHTSQFFSTLNKETDDQQVSMQKVSHHKAANKTRISPCIILAGASNPGANLKPKDEAYDAGQHNAPWKESYSLHYWCLLEYACYVIEETNIMRLHNMTEQYEKDARSQ